MIFFLSYLPDWICNVVEKIAWKISVVSGIYLQMAFPEHLLIIYLVYITSIMLKYIPFISSLFRDFYYKVILSNSLYTSIEKRWPCDFCLLFINVIHYIYYFAYWIFPASLKYKKLVMVEKSFWYWIKFAKILLSIFTSRFIKKIGHSHRWYRIEDPELNTDIYRLLIFYKDVKTVHFRQFNVFNKWC